MTPLSPLIAATPPPPVMEARRWVADAVFPPERPLINLSQAAPVEPPPAPLRAAMAEMLKDPECHLYGPVLGNPDLRDEIAAQWSAAYGGDIRAADVAITAGCNMAFCAAMATLAAPGDAVMLPTPWYFNHKMWLDTTGIETIPIPCRPDMTPDLDAARALMGPRVKAIVLVTPNNPTGAEYPGATVAAFAGLARAAGAALVLDETYRDFDGREGRPHELFADPDWREGLIHLYSFSKAFRLTGHRTGVIVADPARLAEAEKFLDSVVICAPQLGQRAALWGLRNLMGWVAGERAEILRRRDAARAAFAGLDGWELLGAGAYFAYVRHPFAAPSDVVAKRLVHDASLLMLPGTMFAPLRAEGGDGVAEATLRVAFANSGPEGLAETGRRLAAFTAAFREAPAAG
ncbi:aminotransferase [Amaricoccus sp.]|uniref:aminotransferase n=1 Tax=Amaricoccus sp. TaxID=1872485 RepID=UPI001B56704C|nr:aminotransferase [Amaricoccus sp.]MBP7240798.1 aminotransferase [Amaricoccus sp.]